MELVIKIASLVISGLSVLVSIIVALKGKSATARKATWLSIITMLPSLITDAEKTFGSGNGDKKLRMVIDGVRLFALEHGLKVDIEDVTKEVESLISMSKDVNVVKPN